MRILFSRIGTPQVGPATAFSFNEPAGMCPTCEGLGRASSIDVDALAIEMASDASMYVLDEPSTGLHMADVDNLIGLLDRIVDGGRTVLVIEHELDIVARADWVIDLGPGTGHDGSTVVFEGTPTELASAEGSLTGQHLAASHPPA